MATHQTESLSRQIVDTLHLLPLLLSGHVRWFHALSTGIPAKLDDSRAWWARRDLEGKAALRLLQERNVVRFISVSNFLLARLVTDQPIATWSPGQPDLKYDDVRAAAQSQIGGSASSTVRALTAYYLPSTTDRSALSVPSYRRPVIVAERNLESAKGVEIVQSLRTASMYLSVLKADPEAARSWKLNDTEDDVFDLTGPLHADAFVRRRGVMFALRACERRWTPALFAEYQRRMRADDQAHEIW